MFEVRVRDVAEQHVVTEKASLTVEQLDTWIAEALFRENNAIAAAGGATGPSAIIFHGEVNHESDGPIEAITPFNPTGTVDAATRIDPARREAFVTITKAQLDFPEILTAYDAVSVWISENGTQAGPPREIYFADIHAAADDDLVCDVAFPIVSSSTGA